MVNINIEDFYMGLIEQLVFPPEIKSRQAKVNHLLAKALRAECSASDNLEPISE